MFNGILRFSSLCKTRKTNWFCLFFFVIKEVHGIVRKLAEELYNNSVQILSATGKQPFSITPLQMHAITRRIKLPEPPCGKRNNYSFETKHKQRDLFV